MDKTSFEMGYRHAVEIAALEKGAGLLDLSPEDRRVNEMAKDKTDNYGLVGAVAGGGLGALAGGLTGHYLGGDVSDTVLGAGAGLMGGGMLGAMLAPSFDKARDPRKLTPMQTQSLAGLLGMGIGGGMGGLSSLGTALAMRQLAGDKAALRHLLAGTATGAVAGGGAGLVGHGLGLYTGLTR